jgi:hypothetical protein
MFLQTGQTTIPKSWSGRLIYLTAYFTAIVLYIAYSATFISSLAVRRQNSYFTTFEDLLNDGTFRLGLQGKSSYEDYFKVCALKSKMKLGLERNLY